MVVKGTRGNEGAERSGIHDEEQWTKDRALGTPQEDVCQEDRVGEKTLEFSNSVICSVFVPYKYIVTQGLWPCLKIH